MACGRHAPPEDNSPDGQLRRKLIGTWTMDRTLDHAQEVTNIASDSRVLLSANGTFESRFINHGSNFSHDFAYTGTWFVTNGELRSVIKSSSYPNLVPTGTTNQFKITRVESNEMVWFDPGSVQTLYYRRVTSP